eukprot:gene6458-biopygen23882
MQEIDGEDMTATGVSQKALPGGSWASRRRRGNVVAGGHQGENGGRVPWGEGGSHPAQRQQTSASKTGLRTALTAQPLTPARCGFWFAGVWVSPALGSQRLGPGFSSSFPRGLV